MPATKDKTATITIPCPDCGTPLERWGEGQWVCPDCCGVMLTAQAPAREPAPHDYPDPYGD